MITQKKYELHKAYILKNKEITPGTFLLSFKRTFNFSPGQVMALTTKENIPARLYSIASGNSDETIDILYDVKNEGELTPRLSILEKDDMILFSSPFGKFIDNNEPSYWISTGTGIAPFISMIKSGLIKNKKLIHGARNQYFFYFEDFLKSKLGSNYIPCCSQCEDNRFFKGRLTEYLKQKENLSINEKFYLCGSAEMIVDVRDILIDKGVPFNNIISEIYF